ncbi:unnamed protein product, partial [Polarella glacialis]
AISARDAWGSSGSWCMFMLLHVMSLLGQSFCCRLRLRRQLLGQRRRLESTVAAAVVLLASVASATESLCFASSEYYSRAFCCRQSPEQLEGNPECWDGAYTFQACCGPDLPQQANHTGITQRDYLQQCAAGAKSDACDAAAERLAQTMRPELAAEVAPQLCRARPELCRLVLLRAWDVQTRRGRAAHWPGRMEGPEAVAWCTQRAADLRALDPNRFAFSGQPAADATESLKRWDQNPFSLWLRHCGQLQALRVAGSLPQSRRPAAEPTSSAAANRNNNNNDNNNNNNNNNDSNKNNKNKKKNNKNNNNNNSGSTGQKLKLKVGVLMAVAGQAAEDYAEFIRWWQCYADQHGY